MLHSESAHLSPSHNPWHINTTIDPRPRTANNVVECDDNDDAEDDVGRLRLRTCSAT